MSAEAPREPADTPFGQPCQFNSWADMAVKVLIGRDDRFFPAEFQRRVARDRLGIIDPDVIAGGHLVAKSNPAGLAEKLLATPPNWAVPQVLATTVRRLRGGERKGWRGLWRRKRLREPETQTNSYPAGR